VVIGFIDRESMIGQNYLTHQAESDFYRDAIFYSTDDVKKMLINFKLPYITITPTFSICPKHGYIPGEHEFCPYCDEELKQKAKEGELNNSQNSVKIDLKINI